MLLPSANVMNSIFGESLFDDFFEDFARPMRTASRYNKARFEDGILKVTVPKKETKPVIEESRYIPIEG